MRAIRFSWHCQCIKSATVGNISFLLSLSMQRHLLQWQWQLQQGRSMSEGAWQAKVLRDGSKEIPAKRTLECVRVCVCKGALQLSIVIISLSHLDVLVIVQLEFEGVWDFINAAQLSIAFVFCFLYFYVIVLFKLASAVQCCQFSLFPVWMLAQFF